MQSDARPFCRAGQHNEGDLSDRKILLVSYSAIGCEQYFKSGILSRIEQGSVVEPVPTFRLRGEDGMARKSADESFWRAVIKQNEHRQQRKARAATI